MIHAEIIADSINIQDVRLTSFVLTYPRFIHCEVLTHRMFSRNSASSRAIPIKKMIEAILANPVMPSVWGKNQEGMQASETLNQYEELVAQAIWLDALRDVVKHVNKLVELGIHKQITNRLLEPFAHMKTLLTATDFGNYYNLRAHPDAQPEFQELAYQMLEVYHHHQPTFKAAGEWHLPFADKYTQEGLSLQELLKIVTARAARVSYMNFDNSIEHHKDYKLHDRLAASGHWSPFEHAARALEDDRYVGNFRGWYQYRKCFENENRLIYDYDQLINRRGNNHVR